MVRMAWPAALILCPSFGCGVIGPSCLERRQTGAVATVSGEVGPGAIVSHQVPYATDGSQQRVTYTVDITWFYGPDC